MYLQVLSIGLLVLAASLGLYLWENLNGKEDSVTPWKGWKLKF